MRQSSTRRLQASGFVSQVDLEHAYLVKLTSTNAIRLTTQPHVKLTLVKLTCSAVDGSSLDDTSSQADAVNLMPSPRSEGDGRGAVELTALVVDFTTRHFDAVNLTSGTLPTAGPARRAVRDAAGRDPWTCAI